MSTDRAWMYRKNDRDGFLSRDYVVAMDNFLDRAYANPDERHVERKTTPDGIVLRTRCPCAKCKNMAYRERDEVRLHLMKYGFMLDYTIWYSHGETYNRASREKLWDSEADRCQSRIAGTNWWKFKGVSSKYTGGSISTDEHRNRMRDELGREPTDAELYERLHTSIRKRVSNVTHPPMDPPPKVAKMAKTHAQVEDETCVGSNFDTVPLDDPKLSKDSVGSQHKGRLSGFHTDQYPKCAKTGDPKAISSTKRSLHDSQLVEVNALKEKLASYEDQLKTEKKRRLALEQRHKETADALARQTELVQHFLASVKQFEHGNSPIVDKTQHV